MQAKLCWSCSPTPLRSLHDTTGKGVGGGDVGAGSGTGDIGIIGGAGVGGAGIGGAGVGGAGVGGAGAEQLVQLLLQFSAYSNPPSFAAA